MDRKRPQIEGEKGSQPWLMKVSAQNGGADEIDFHLVFVSDETEWETPLWREWVSSIEEDVTHPAIAEQSDLCGANLERAQLALGDFRGVDARGVNLHLANLSYANFAGADLVGADLSCADLCKANFTGCDMQGADVRGADLAFASFLDADIRGARFNGVKLENTEFRNCVFDLGTELPFDMETALAIGMHLYDSKW